MDARERALGLRDIGGGHAAAIGRGEIGADAHPHVGVVFVAGDEDEDGDEAVELVRPRQSADARALVEHQDLDDEAVERLDVDLPQLVARIFLQDMDDRLAGMAFRVEAGALEDLGDLVAQIGDLAHRAGVGGRGEEADDAQLALEPAFRREQLDADIVHVDAAVDLALDVRLGDDQHRRLAHELADLRRHHDELAPRRRILTSGSARMPRPGPFDNVGRRHVVRGEAVFAHAQKGEVVGAQPLQQLVRLGDLVDRQRAADGP